MRLFEQAKDFDDGRTMHVRANGEGVEEVVIVYTDIEAPKATAFATVHDLLLTVNPKTAEDGDFQSIAVHARTI